MGGTLTGALKQSLSAFPTGSLGPIGGLLGAGLVAGFGAALIGIGKEFGAARRQIIQETGQTGDALAGTFASVKRVFADVPASLHEVTTAVDLLRQRGIPLGQQLENLAKQEIELSKITKTDLATNVEATTALFSKFSVTLRDQPAALDAIFKASQQSGKGLADLLDNLKTGATVLGQFGFDIKESAALIATLEKAGVNATPALAGLKKAFGEITKAGGDPKKALQDLIDEFTNGTAPAQAMADAMKLFGNRAGAELATAIQKGKFDVKDLLKTITDGKGGILATAESTRTLSERLQILKNRAELALEPLASAVWKEVKQIFLDLEVPVGHLVTSLGEFGKAAAPLVAVIGVGIVGAFKLLGPVIDAFATGLSTVADILSHIPTPVLIAAGAALALAKGFLAIKAALEAQALAGFLADLNPVTAGLVIAAAAITALGFVIHAFGGQASAASVESKALTTALFDVGKAGAFFKDNITSSAQGLTEFLIAQDAAGKNKNLKDALDATGTTLQEVGKAVAGTSQDFERLKASVVDTSGFNKQQKALLASGDAALLLAQQNSGLNQEQLRAVQSAQAQADALDQQRDAFTRSAQSELEAAARSGDLGKAQFAQAEAIAHNTVGIHGYGAALDFANQAIAEHARKEQDAADKTVAAAGGQKALTRAVLDGAVGTDGATAAVGKYGLSLDKTKTVIADTQAALKKFTDEGLAGFGNTTSVINDWSANIDRAFQSVVDAAGKTPVEVAAAQAALVAATDPHIVVQNLQAQAQQIASFTTNILALVQRFPETVKALIADPNKGAAAAMAQAIIDNPTIGKQFESAQTTVAQKTAVLKGLLEGPLAQELLGGGTAMGEATAKGYSEAVHFEKPTQVQVLKATQVIEKHKKAHAKVAAAMGQGAGARYLQSFDLGGPTAKQVEHARLIVEAAKNPHGRAAKRLGAEANTKYGGALKLPQKTASSVAGAAGAFTGKEASTVADRAAVQGGRIGVAFGEGIAGGMGQSGVISDIETAAAAAALAAKAAAEKALGVKSPSTVAITIGRSFGDGLAIGIRDAAPKVAIASNKMATDMARAWFQAAAANDNIKNLKTLLAGAVRDVARFAPHPGQGLGSLDPVDELPGFLDALQTVKDLNRLIKHQQARKVAAFAAPHPAASARPQAPTVHIEKLYARDDEDVARVIAAQQRRQYLLSTL